jgi:hypothetical protein
MTSASASDMRRRRRRRRLFSSRNVILVILFLGALGIRLEGLESRPFDFHPVKQFRSALTARAFYFESNSATAEKWQQDVASASLSQIETLVLPIVDRVAAAAYGLLGSESLVVARFLSVLFWMIGGVFLYRIGLKTLSADGAIVALAFYLLLPFGVIASQSFQPDPLMVLLLLVSVDAILAYDTRPSARNLSIAALLSAFAVLTKPVSFPILFPAFAALAIRRSGVAAGVLGRHTLAFGAVTLLPSLVYYGYQILAIDGAMQTQASKSFVPGHFFDFRFWDGWQKRIRIVMGFTPFVAGLVGALMQTTKRGRALVPGLWVGYLLMCVLFNYTISTHDYYHLPLIPIVALSLGALSAPILESYRSAHGGWHSVAAAGLIALALFLSLGTSYQARQRVPDFENRVDLAVEIGAAVDHSTLTIHLAPYQGFPLMYYGQISGRYWPYWFDIRDERLWMAEPPDTSERLAGLMRDFPAEYFIVADLEEFTRQDDLREFLFSAYPVDQRSAKFLVFDLTSPFAGPR